jgi:hypothetical protein
MLAVFNKLFFLYFLFLCLNSLFALYSFYCLFVFVQFYLCFVELMFVSMIFDIKIPYLHVYLCIYLAFKERGEFFAVGVSDTYDSD